VFNITVRLGTAHSWVFCHLPPTFSHCPLPQNSPVSVPQSSPSLVIPFSPFSENKSPLCVPLQNRADFFFDDPKGGVCGPPFSQSEVGDKVFKSGLFSLFFLGCWCDVVLCCSTPWTTTRVPMPDGTLRVSRESHPPGALANFFFSRTTLHSILFRFLSWLTSKSPARLVVVTLFSVLHPLFFFPFPLAYHSEPQLLFSSLFSPLLCAGSPHGHP